MTTVKQFSLARGEIPPSLYARTDQVGYAIGLKTLRNFFVMRHGGAANRAGTQFTGETKVSAQASRLIDFIFNEDQAYALEFGDQYIRVIFQGSYIMDDPLDITGVTQASPGVLTIPGVELEIGDEVYIDGVVGMTELNGLNLRVLTTGPWGWPAPEEYTFEYLDGTPLDTSGFSAYVSGGEVSWIFTIDSPYLEDDIFRLKYFQSADVMTILHNDYDPRELKRTGHTSWTLEVQSRAPLIDAPTGIGADASGTFNHYVVTAIANETSEESLPSVDRPCGTKLPGASPDVITLTWIAVSGAEKYGVYRRINGIYYFVNFAGSTTFADDGITPDFGRTPPAERDPFDGATNRPATGAYVQSRLFMGNLLSNTEIIHGSQIGNFKNFNKSEPILSSNTVSFNLPGRTVNEIRHLVDLKKLVVLTSNGEWSCSGNSAGIIVPGEVNPTQHGYNGSSHLRPIIIGETIVYVQAQGSKIRDLFLDFEEVGYKGTDISVWGSHLLDKYEIIDWAYEKEPHSIIWAVRDDGIVVGVTYIRDQKLIAYHRHDFTNGLVESVTAIPEGGRTVIYFIIKRIIDGRIVRYVERMMERFVDEVEDNIFLDCSLTYDGWNTDEDHTMKIFGGTTWGPADTLTIESSVGYFLTSHIGTEIHLKDDEENVVRFTITGSTPDPLEPDGSATRMYGKVDRIIPTSLRDTVSPSLSADPIILEDVITDNWSVPITDVTGLDHLEGQTVGVFADAFVVGSPNNNSMAAITVVDGSITLDRPYSKIHVGLPILPDLYSLDIDTVKGETLMDKEKLISNVDVHLEDTRGLWAGTEPPSDDDDDATENLFELRIREDETMYEPVRLVSEVVSIDVLGEYNRNGSIFLRQIDPVPIQILAIAPSGLIPYKKFGG